MQMLPPGIMHMQGHGQVATGIFKNFSQLLSRLLLGVFWLLSEENLSGPCMFHQHVPVSDAKIVPCSTAQTG